MKFAQFVELEETLKDNGYKMEDLKEELKKEEGDKELFEFFGINKALMSWGISGIMKGKLDKQSKKFMVDTGQVIEDSIKQLVRAKNKIKQSGEISPEGMKQIGQIELQIIKIVNNTIEKLGKLKTQQIEQRIESSKRMKDSAKLGLNYFWTKLMTDAKVTLLTFLMKQKVIEDSGNLRAMEKFLEKEEVRSKEKAKEANQNIKNQKKEEEGSGEKKSEKKSEPSAGEKTGSEL
jgi:hypothetical protein